MEAAVKEKEQEERARQQDYYENILANVPGHVYWKDKQGRYLGCNDQMAKTIGLSSRHKVIGMTDIDIGKTLNWPIEIAQGFRNEDIEVLKNGQPKYNIESSPVRNAEGQKLFLLRNKVPLKNSQGEIIGVMGISVDVTELRKTQAQLREAAVKDKEKEEQIRTMRIFAGGIAHELRTPLAAIVGAGTGIVKFMPRLVEGYNLAKNANLDVPLIRKEHLEILKDTAAHIVHEGEYSLSIITMMLVTAQNANIDNKNFTNLSMVNIVLEALKTFSFQDPNDQVLVHFIQENDFQFWGDPTLTIHIMFNLIKNALFLFIKREKGRSPFGWNIKR